MTMVLAFLATIFVFLFVLLLMLLEKQRTLISDHEKLQPASGFYKRKGMVVKDGELLSDSTYTSAYYEHLNSIRHK